jgi:D-alanine-D-alanine ligase
VQDLERHVPAEWWTTLFGSLYLLTDGDVVENPENTAQEVDWVVRAAGLAPGHRILDLACGQGRHTLELAARGFTALAGRDQSDYLIGVARRRARAAGHAVDFAVADMRTLAKPAHPYDAVLLLGNSFGYAGAEDDRAALRCVREQLAPGGTVLLDLTDGAWTAKNFEARSWEWIDRDRLACRERQLSADRQRLVCRELVIDRTQGILADQFYAERLYTRARLAKLLKSAGFTDIRDHAGLVTASSRGQDLGMMGRRILLTAHRG